MGDFFETLGLRFRPDYPELPCKRPALIATATTVGIEREQQQRAFRRIDF